MTDLDKINKGYYDSGPISNGQLDPTYLSPYNINTLEELKNYGNFSKSQADYLKRKFNIPEDTLNWTLPYIRKDEMKNFDSDPWMYTTNQYGFRDIWREKAKRPNLGFYGCSFTYGEGVESKKLWTTKVAEHYKFNNFNFGVGGASALKVARTFVATNRVLNLNHAIILLPSITRVDYSMIYDKQNSHMTRAAEFMPNLNPEYGQRHGEEGLPKKHKEIYIAFDDNLFIMNLIYAVSMITECAKAHNVKIVFATWDAETLYTLDKINAPNLYPNIGCNMKDYARDGAHPGPITNQNFANDIIQWLNADNGKVSF
tara:strand:- start:5362 stop:6303 length:942 start_codon:yes stop_codon:yes gene_type:complete